jgi:hypothetical protein
MGYDLMVFEPSAPPSDRAGFLVWYHEQTKWAEHRDYNDPTGTADALGAWFLDMIERFPALNGPLAGEDFDSSKIADYSIGSVAIYAGFAWRELQDAYRATFELAIKHRLGFFDVSAEDGQVWMPQGAAGFRIVHGTGSSLGPGKGPL